MEKSPKPWLHVFLLCWFLGCFGAHRFYTGHTKTGIAQAILTVCTCGIGAIWGVIDFWMIIFGKFVDAEGKPVLRD